MPVNAYAKRPCRAHNPDACPYHRNIHMTQTAKNMAERSLKDGNFNLYTTFTQQAEAYADLQRRIESGDEDALQKTREDIAEQYPHRPAYGPKGATRQHLTFNAKNWKKLQEYMEKREVSFTVDSTSVDAMGNVILHGFHAEGEHNDVYAVTDTIHHFQQKERRAVEQAEAGMRQNRPSTMQTSAEIAANYNPNLRPATSFNPNTLSPRDQRERLGVDSSSDTPTEKVITLPSFEEIANFITRKSRKR